MRSKCECGRPFPIKEIKKRAKWIICPNCGDRIHLKFNKTGRLKKTICHHKEKQKK